MSEVLAEAAELASRCREDYVRVSNEADGAWTFCESCPRRGDMTSRTGQPTSPDSAPAADGSEGDQ